MRSEMTKQEFLIIAFAIVPDSHIKEMEKFVDWLIEHREQIPEKEKK
jgi:hypothetical protein